MVKASEQAERRIREWYASTERYTALLHEMDQAEYLDMKRKEIKRLEKAAGRRKEDEEDQTAREDEEARHPEGMQRPVIHADYLSSYATQED